MGYTIRIRNNETQEVRKAALELPWENHTHFWLTEGNYGCDCNRGLAFERAAGADPEWGSQPCGDSKFSILDATLPDGTVIKVD